MTSIDVLGPGNTPYTVGGEWSGGRFYVDSLEHEGKDVSALLDMCPPQFQDKISDLALQACVEREYAHADFMDALKRENPDW